MTLKVGVASPTQSFGSISFGCNADREIGKVKKKMEKNDPYISSRSFDLNNGLKSPSNHSVPGYLKEDDFQYFLKETINE